MSKNSLKELIKNPPRFILDNDSSRLTVVDIEGVDDYWFLDDVEEVENLVKLLNELNEENRRLRHLVLQLQSKLDTMPNLGDVQQEIMDRLTLSDDFFKDKECRCIKTNIQLESEEVNKDD